MSQSDVATGRSDPTEAEPDRDEAGDGADAGFELPVEPRTAGSIFAGAGGAVSAIAGLRALRRGQRGLGLARLGLGAVLVTIALALRRASEAPERIEATVREGVQQRLDEVAEADAATETTDTEPTGGATGQTETETEAAAVTTAERPATEDSGDGIERDGDAAEDAAYERLGAAAFDEYASEVPAPQRVFNIELLELSAEAFWGVREADDAVLVSHDFDALQDADGVRYVGSSEIDGERTLSIPDVILNHWSDAAGGGTVVESGTELTFATNDDLRADGQLLVAPAFAVEELLGANE